MGFASAESRTGWIGVPPTATQITANLIIGTIGMIICGVQPVLLGALVAEKRLSAAGLGWATTAEFLALGIGILAAGTFLKTRRLPLIAIIAALVTGLADIAMVYDNGSTILLNRAVSGLGEAVLVWITGSMIARSPTPARWAAVFLTLQGLSQLAFAALMPLSLMATHGANGGFVGMAFTATLAGAAALFLPSEMADLPIMERSRLEVLSSPSAILMLLTVFLIAAFSIGLFVYAAPLALQAGLNGTQLGFIVSIILGSSILGSAAAALLPKLPYYPIFVACMIANAIVLAVIWMLPGFLTFCIAAAVFGFMWLFFLPYQLPMALEVDPTRQIAVVLGGAQLLGGSAGPFLCSFFVTDADSRGALTVVGACFMLAFMISSVLHLRQRGARQGIGAQPSVARP